MVAAGIVLLYHFHHSLGFSLHVVPYLDSETRGLFATRAPERPNPIGLSVVQLDRIEKGVLHIRNVDMLDGTPLLDIKPYVPEFDAQMEVRTGCGLKRPERPSQVVNWMIDSSSQEQTHDLGFAIALEKNLDSTL